MICCNSFHPPALNGSSFACHVCRLLHYYATTLLTTWTYHAPGRNQLDENFSSASSDNTLLRTVSARAQLCPASRSGGLHQQQESKQVCYLSLCLKLHRIPDKNKSPREAAMAIARLANHRNPHIALLSLSLLDTLVQSCGYAFHLQISTKEFLNELVRRFPERPPPFPNPVMTRILDLIHGWKEGICSDSRWKEDLGNIRDMHRLLTFKGYRFREIGRQSSTLNAMVRSGTACQFSMPYFLFNRTSSQQKSWRRRIAKHSPPSFKNSSGAAHLEIWL